MSKNIAYLRVSTLEQDNSKNKTDILSTVKNNWQLDNIIKSKIMAMVFAKAAEIERDLISQWTKEALRVKKANGMILGRP